MTLENMKIKDNQKTELKTKMITKGQLLIDKS